MAPVRDDDVTDLGQCSDEGHDEEECHQGQGDTQAVNQFS